MADLDLNPSLDKPTLKIPNWKVFLLGSFFLLSLFPLMILFDTLGLSIDYSKPVTGYAVIIGSFGVVISFFTAIAERLGLIDTSNSRGQKGSPEDRGRIEFLEKEISRIGKIQDQSKEEYIDQIRPVLSEVAQSYFSQRTFTQIESEVATRYGDGVDISVKVREIKEVFSSAKLELEIQLQGQRTNQNINLMLGLVFATLGIAILGYVFYGSYLNGTHPIELDVKTFILNFIPKVTFVVLIETVAFFFLSLYREDRGLIRYFRNELTNLECRFIALETAVRLDDRNTLSKVIMIYANTERNFTIKKGDVLISQSIREEDDRLFSKLIDRLSINFDLSKIGRQKMD